MQGISKSIIHLGGFDATLCNREVPNHCAQGGEGGKATVHASLIKKKIKISSYIRKFKMEQLQSHICGRAS